MLGDSSPHKSSSRMLCVFDRNDVAAEQRADQPAGQHADLPLPCRKCVEVIETMDQPRQKAGKSYAPGLESAASQPEGGDCSQIVMNILFGRPASQRRSDTARKETALSYGVLCVRNDSSAW